MGAKQPADNGRKPPIRFEAIEMKSGYAAFDPSRSLKHMRRNARSCRGRTIAPNVTVEDCASLTSLITRRDTKARRGSRGKRQAGRTALYGKASAVGRRVWRRPAYRVATWPHAPAPRGQEGLRRRLESVVDVAETVLVVTITHDRQGFGDAHGVGAAPPRGLALLGSVGLGCRRRQKASTSSAIIRGPSVVRRA